MKTDKPLTKKDLYDMEQGYNVYSNYIINNQYYLIVKTDDNTYSLINASTKEKIITREIELTNSHNTITSIIDNLPGYKEMWNGDYLINYDNQYCIIMFKNEDSIELIHIPSNKKITFNNVEGDITDVNNYNNETFSISFKDEIYKFSF